MTGSELDTEESVEVSLYHWTKVRIRKGKFFIDFPFSDIENVGNQLTLLKNSVDNFNKFADEIKQVARK